MRVLIADKFERSGKTGLEEAGCTVIYEPDVKEQTLSRAVADSAADVLVVRSTVVSENALESGRLKLVVRAGAGYNTIDIGAASKRGIYVSNCPGANSIAVAELAFALILALDRQLADNVISMREGKWDKKRFSAGRGLYGRTLGLVGVGKIGREMIPRAKAFGMRIVGWSRALTAESAGRLGIERAETLEAVAESADVVSVHLALTAETRDFIGRDFFTRMKEGSYFINTSRGEVVDQVALVDAMRTRSIRAGLDVYATEPTSGTAAFEDPIRLEPNLYGTHHIGASTEQAQEAIAAETVRIVKTFKDTGHVPNVVNLAKETPATHRLVVRHRDRPGVLAAVLDELRTSNINVQEMENVVFEGAEAAVARINIDRAPTGATLERIRANAAIMEIDLLQLTI